MSSPPSPDGSSSSSNNSSSTSDSESPPPSSFPPPTDAESTPPPSSSPPPPLKPSDDGGDGHSPPPPLPLPPPSPPPPPHNHHLTPPDPDHSTDHSHKRQDANLTVIIGLVAGLGLCFLLMIILCVLCSKRKKKPHDPMQYYAEGSAKQKDGGLNGSGKEQNWRNGQQNMEHIIKVPPWQPPATMMSNSDASSVNSGPHATPLPPPSPIIALGFNKSNFSYEELAAATNNFSPANLLGQGGFGYVHKGVLPNGKEIAVKQLKAESGQGEREFQAEVDIISRVHHRHLVSLVGYCIAGSQRMLVYEFVPNSTLEYHLHGKGLPVMQWSTRLKIALGAARGIAYLHEDCHPRIIHRDIKAANILLDFKFEAMVADFGLAKLSSDNHTHVSTRVMGTFGYLAPEYASSGKLTEKSDVFSYGVMLLELITGRRPVDNAQMEDSLVDWARPLLSRALDNVKYDAVADPRLDGNYDPMEMARMVAAAAASVRHSAKKRPKMSQIVRALEGVVSLEDLNEGVKPGNSMLFSSSPEYEASSIASSANRGT